MKNLNFVIGEVKKTAKDVEAHLVVDQCKKLLSEYFDNVIVSQHVDIDLSSKSENVDLKLVRYDGKLCLFFGDESIPSQLNLDIKSDQFKRLTFSKVGDVSSLELER